MGQEPQSFVTPDGTEMVILPAKEYARLIELVDDALDVEAAKNQLARLAAGEGTMPSEVLRLILAENLTAIAAWRKYRGMTQDELARTVGATQAWLSQIESGARHGRPKLRKALAKALNAPLWALEDED